MRRNQRSVPPLPAGWELLSVAYGTGKDDYLGVVLAYQEHDPDSIRYSDNDKYVTWIWNSDIGCEGVGEGHYFDQWSYKDADALYEAAWKDFIKRSTPFVQKAHQWPKVHPVDIPTGR